MSTYPTWYLSLAGFLLVVGPLSAQAPAEAPQKMIIAVWTDTTGGLEHRQAHEQGCQGPDRRLRGPHQAQGWHGGGKGEVPQSPRSRSGSAEQRHHDRATVRLSTPPASGTDSASGYESSGKPSQLSPEDLQKIQGMFGPGESALLLLSPTPAVSEIKRPWGLGPRVTSRSSSWRSRNSQGHAARAAAVRPPPIFVRAAVPGPGSRS